MNSKFYKKALAGTLILIQMTAFSLPALGAVGLQNFTVKQAYTNNHFQDIQEGQWYQDVVKSCYEMGLMVGKSANRFDPQGNVTVAEAISFGARIHSTFNGKVDNEIKSENKNAHWYDGAVAYALENQIIKSGDFTDYNRNATRSEMAYIIGNLMPKNQWQVVRQVKRLPDVDVSNKNYDKIIKLYEAGVLTGNDVYGSFKCDTNISRAEIAAILNRVVVEKNRCNIPLVEQPTTPVTPTPVTPVKPTPVTPTTPVTPVTPTPVNPGTTVEAYASEVYRLVNVERQKAGLNPVEFLSNVTGAANIRAKELETSFSHTRPNGSSTFTVLDALNGGFKTMGENIAMGQKTPAEVMNAWMNSSGHRANILKANFTGLGVGVYKTASGTLCWAQLFVG